MGYNKSLAEMTYGLVLVFLGGGSLSFADMFTSDFIQCVDIILQMCLQIVALLPGA